MVVIVCGLPGSGKSYFASRLASVLGAEYINSDKVRKELNALGRYSLSDKLSVYNEMVKVTIEFIKEKKIAVVDGTFYLDFIRQMFQAGVKQWCPDIFFIHIYASESLVKERLSKPRKYSEANFEVYLDVRDKFEEIKTPHLELESTNGNLTSMLDQAVAYIKG